MGIKSGIKLKLDLRQELIGSFEKVSEDKILRGVNLHKNGYRRPSATGVNGRGLSIPYKIRGSIEDMLFLTDKELKSVTLLGILEYMCLLSVLTGTVSILDVFIIVGMFYGVKNVKKTMRDYKGFIRTLGIGLLTPLILLVKFTMKLKQKCFGASSKEVELSHKIKTLYVFKESLTTDSILKNEERIWEYSGRLRGNKGRQDLERLYNPLEGDQELKERYEEERNLEYYERNMALRYSEESDSDKSLIEHIYFNLSKGVKEVGINAKIIDILYHCVLKGLNQEIELPNGYITRFYNILDSDIEGIKYTTQFRVLGNTEDDNKKKVLNTTEELTVSLLTEVIGILESDYVESKKYDELKKAKESLISKELERLETINYINQNRCYQENRYKDIQDKLMVNNSKKKWEKRLGQTEEDFNSLGNDLKTIGLGQGLKSKTKLK